MSDSRTVAGLFLVSLLARLVSALGLFCFATDSANFMTMADWMRGGRFQDALAIGYHPLYPLLVSVVSPVFGGTIAAGHAVSILLGAAASVPLYFLIREMFGSQAAFLATLLYALHQRIVDVQSDVMTESTFMFFFLWSMLLAWRMMQDPTPQRGVALALAAGGAYLARAEGILALLLAVGWPVLGLVGRGRPSAGACAALVVTPIVLLVILSPYLMWVKSMRGHWALSVRGSLVSAELALGVGTPSQVRLESAMGEGKLYRNYLSGFLRINLYGALFPFHFLGFMNLKGLGFRKALFYFGTIVGLLGGVLFTLRHHNAMSERYLMVATTLLFGVAAVGLLAAFRFARERWPQAAWRAPAGAALILALTLFPAVRWMAPRRLEDRGYADAARWIVSRAGRPEAISGVSQVAYYAGALPLIPPSSRQDAEDQILRQKVRCFVYEERDVETRKPYVALLQSFEFLEPAVRVPSAPGSVTVLVQFVK